MKTALIFAIVFGLIIFSFLYDMFAGLTHTNGAHFHEAPAFMCGTAWKTATIPPFGIWICNSPDAASLRTQALARWNQYQHFGTIGYYGNRGLEWIGGWFDRFDNWVKGKATAKQ